MSSSTRRLLALVPAALLAAVAVGAQSPPPPPAGRWEVTALAGYRIEGGISTRNAPEVKVLDLGDAATYGLALDWQISASAPASGSRTPP
jgi:hypothetical protein